MHISEIGQKSGVESRKAARILRLLASKHIFKEGERLGKLWSRQTTNSSTVSENVFANNRLSIQFISNNPLSSLGLHLSVSFTFLSNAYLDLFKSTVLMSLSSQPYCSQKSCRIKSWVLRMLQIGLLLKNTLVYLTPSSNITKGYVVFLIHTVEHLKSLRQPPEGLNVESTLV